MKLSAESRIRAQPRRSSVPLRPQASARPQGGARTRGGYAMVAQAAFHAGGIPGAARRHAAGRRRTVSCCRKCGSRAGGSDSIGLRKLRGVKGVGARSPASLCKERHPGSVRPRAACTAFENIKGSCGRGPPAADAGARRRLQTCVLCSQDSQQTANILLRAAKQGWFSIESYQLQRSSTAPSLHRAHITVLVPKHCYALSSSSISSTSSTTTAGDVPSLTRRGD